MKNILIPFDFSDTAENALVYAISLFEDCEVTFHLLYVYESTPSELLNDDYNENWLKQIDHSLVVELKQYIKKLNENKSKNHQFLEIVLIDSLIYSIRYILKVEPIDLIISGTKGARDRSDIFITTRTLTIIKRIENCPILLVPYDYNFIKINKVILSTNFKKTINTKEIQYVLDICKLHESFLEVVNLTEHDLLGLNQKEHKTSLEFILSSFDHSFKKLDWLGSESNTLMNYIESSKCQILCLIRHKHSFFYKLFEEDIIKRTAFNSQIPILFI